MCYYGNMLKLADKIVTRLPSVFLHRTLIALVRVLKIRLLSMVVVAQLVRYCMDMGTNRSPRFWDKLGNTINVCTLDVLRNQCPARIQTVQARNRTTKSASHAPQSSLIRPTGAL